jgi:hypothetical protein
MIRSSPNCANGSFAYLSANDNLLRTGPSVVEYDLENGTFTDLAVELVARRIGCAVHVVVQRHEKSEVCVHFAVMQGVESAEENGEQSHEFASKRFWWGDRIHTDATGKEILLMQLRKSFF